MSVHHVSDRGKSISIPIIIERVRAAARSVLMEGGKGWDKETPYLLEQGLGIGPTGGCHVSDRK